MHPLTAGVRKHLIFKVGRDEVILAVTCLLNPGELAVVCEVTHNAVVMWLQNMETNLKKMSSAWDHRMFEQGENVAVSSPQVRTSKP